MWRWNPLRRKLVERLAQKIAAECVICNGRGESIGRAMCVVLFSNLSCLLSFRLSSGLRQVFDDAKSLQGGALLQRCLRTCLDMAFRYQ